MRFSLYQHLLTALCALVQSSRVGRSAPHTPVFVLNAVANRYKFKPKSLWSSIVCALVLSMHPALVYGQTPLEERQLEADHLLEEGQHALGQIDSDPLPFLQAALTIYQEIGDRSGESQTLGQYSWEVREYLP